MKHLSLVTVALFGSLVLANAALGRVFPGSGSGRSNPAVAARAVDRIQNPKYGNYGDWGGGTVYQFNNGLVGNLPQRQDSAQNMLMQSGIRNTLTSQGQARTEVIASQRQSYRDWWYQLDQQQSAGRSLGRGASFERLDAPPPAAMDVIQWPPLLQDPAFASRRTLIEAPYRRSPPGLSPPTVKDYRDMIAIVDEMKDILEWLTREVVDAQEYNQAKAFLEKLQQEARQRVSRDSTTKPKT
jgi:hypothetical protein